MSVIGRVAPFLGIATPLTYATWDPANKASNVTLSGGNLTAALASGGTGMVRATIGKSSGKWYWENTIGINNLGQVVGICNSSQTFTGVYPGGSSANGWSYRDFDGKKFNGGGGFAYGSTWNTGDVMGVALDMDAGTLIFYKNNVSQGTAYTGLTGTIYAAWGGSVGTNSAATTNFGATAFAYTPPSGYAGLST